MALVTTFCVRSAAASTFISIGDLAGVTIGVTLLAIDFGLRRRSSAPGAAPAAPPSA